MNAIMALLTAASVLAHAALGCCVHHVHGPSPVCLGSHPLPTKEHQCEVGHAHSGDHDHEHSGGDEQVPLSPHRHCDEGFCSAVAGTAPGTLLKPAHAAFDLAPPIDLSLAAGRPSLHTGYTRLQHDLGPPLRSHLCNLVLLI